MDFGHVHSSHKGLSLYWSKPKESIRKLLLNSWEGHVTLSFILSTGKGTSPHLWPFFFFHVVRNNSLFLTSHMVQNQRNVSCKEPLSVRLNLLQSQPPLNIFGLFLLSKFFHILVNYNFEVIFNFKELFYIRKTDEGKGM